MKNIVDWLDANTSDSAFTFENNADVEQRAEIIRAKAEAAGYSADELLDACGGDIAEYLRNGKQARDQMMLTARCRVMSLQSSRPASINSDRWKQGALFSVESVLVIHGNVQQRLCCASA